VSSQFPPVINIPHILQFTKIYYSN